MTVDLRAILAALGSRWPVVTGPGWAMVHGGSREVMAAMPDKCIDVFATDPPYDAITHSRGGGAVRRYDGGPDIAKIPFPPLGPPGPYADQIARLVKRWSLVFCAVRQIEEWCLAMESAGVNVPRVIVWTKPDASPQFSGDRPGHGYEPIIVAHPVGRTRWNGGGKKGVYEHLRMDRQSGFLHPTQKPLTLMMELVDDFTDPGEIVCDPFAGSGTSGVASIRRGRMFIGIERLPLPDLPIDDETNPDFFGRACRRLAGDESRPRIEQPGLFDRPEATP